MASDPQRIQEVFLAVLEQPTSDRTAILDRECSADAELRQRVEVLLAAHDASGSFLKQPQFEVGQTVDSKVGARAGLTGESGHGGDDLSARLAATTNHRAIIEPGIVIAGRYMLQEKLGEGGMGEVWVAKQTEPVKRRVALKLIKAGMDSKDVVTRFEQERQALAMMDHPNIARVLDGGMTPAGQPFFVMELVNGLPLTKFCDEAKLTPKQRLELYLPICQAVQHAHQKGIIHRDLKPANILVTLIDGQPVPKVIDFGVAKAAAGRLTEESMSTQFGAVVGTLEYMSPEQAGFSGIDIDTRTDIYSLGVILYELLTGLRPIDAHHLKKAAIADMLRMIQEEEPSKPSTRLSTAESLQSLAALRQTEPNKLMALLRGELDWVVMKCLEKKRDRRYDTATGLARDIQRYLADEPVEARPPSAGYRLSKFLRRHKGPAVATGLVLLALLAGIAGTTRGMIAANEALRAEEAQRTVAERAAVEMDKARAVAANERDQKDRALRAESAQRIVAERVAKEREQARAVAESERDQKESARTAAEKALYFNRINLAAQYWQALDLVQSRRILDLCAPPSRGWEWRYLDRLHHADLQTLQGNGQFTTELHLSKDGNRLAAFSPYGDAGVRIWDLVSGKPLIEIKGLSFTCCALRRDGRMLALGDKSGVVTFWNTETGQKTRDFKKLPRSTSSLSFSPDGKLLAAARANPRNGEMLIPSMEPPREEDLVVWNTDSGAEVFHPKGFGFAALFSPDGKRLLTLKKNSSLRLLPQSPETFVALLDTSTWKEVNPGQLGSAASFSFNAKGTEFALAGYDRYRNVPFVRIIDAETGRETNALSPTMRGANFDVALSPDGSIVALTKGIGFSEIEVWDLKSKRQVQTLRGHTGTVNNTIFTPDGKLLSCSWDKTIKLWDPLSEPEVRQVVAPCSMQANPALLAPGGQLLAFANRGMVNMFTGPLLGITIVDCGSDRRSAPAPGGILPALSRAMLGDEAQGTQRMLTGNARGTLALAFNANGQRLASAGYSASYKNEVQIWDITKMAEVATYDGHKGEITALALSPDGRRAASADEPEEFSRWRFQHGEFPQTAIPVAVKVWDAESGKEQFALAGHANSVQQLAFSPDGRLLASAGSFLGGGHGTKIWDMTSGTLLRELDQSQSQSGNWDALSFSSDGTLLETAGDQVIQLWDVSSGHSVAVFHGHKVGKLRVAISPDRSRLASAAGQQVKIWDAGSGLEALSLPLRPTKPDEIAPTVASLAWSTDGQRLCAVLSNGSVVEWDGTP